MSPDALVEHQHPRNTRLLVGVSVGFYVLLCSMIFAGIWHANNGKFVYSLDDPYIHLALSEQIAHGHYGINAGEPGSPSSSVLWPLLLAPYARFAWQPIVPLLLNFIFGLGTAALLGLAVAQWPVRPAPREKLRRAVSTVGLALIGNLIGLTFLGMEHTLQLLLTAACALGIVAVLRGQRIPAWCLVAAALGPSVRYESVGLVLAMALALIGQRRHRAAAVLVAVSIAPLIAFSFFLHHMGLPWLPVSVMVKGNAVGAHASFSHRMLIMIADFWELRATDGYHRMLAELVLLLAVVSWRERSSPRRMALAGAAMAAGLHLAIGKFGWFYRYEVYILLFSAMVLLYILHELPRLPMTVYVVLLFAFAAPYLPAIRDTIASSHDIYLQQNQMHRFVTDFYTGNVAINDLGMVSYRRRPGTDVLDLDGLGSFESARQLNKSVAWLDFVTREHHTNLVMIYPNWFAVVPIGWTRLGELCLVRKPISLGGNCVDYYATPMAPLATMQRQFEAFARTLPPGIQVNGDSQGPGNTAPGNLPAPLSPGAH